LVLLCLAILAGLTAAILWRMPAKEVKKPVTDVKIVGPVQTLEPGKPIEMELGGGEGHAYELSLESGQYFHIVAEQKGIDVALRVKGPDGGSPTYVDSPIGKAGPEHFFAVTSAPGLWRVEVIAESRAVPPGKYQINVEPPRTATNDDQKRAGAWTLFNQGEDLLQRVADFNAARLAVEKYQGSLTLWRALSDRSWEAETLYRVGWAHQYLADYADALSSLQAALPLFQEMGKRAEEGIILNRIGESNLRLGEWEKAREAHSKAAEILRLIQRPDLEGEALSGVGNALNALGKGQQALDTFRKALELARAEHNLVGEALALHGIGDVLTAQGKFAEAHDALEDTLRLYSTSSADRFAEATTLMRMADVDQQLGHFSQAQEELGKALKIKEDLHDESGQAVILLSLGTAHLLARETEPASLCYQKALVLYRGRKNRHGEALSLLNLGRHACEIKDYRRCLSFHEQAGEIFRTLEDRRSEAGNQYGIARALSGLGDLTGAQERLAKVLDNVEEFRAETGSINLGTTYFATRQRYYELYIDVLMRLAEQHPESRYGATALEINERRRARGLLDQLMASPAGAERGADTTLLARERDLQARIDGLEITRLNRIDQRASKELIDVVEKQQRDFLQQLEEVRAQIRATSPHYADLTRPVPLKLEDIQGKVLDKGTLLLVFSLGEERSFVWCLPPTGNVVTRILPARSLIEDAARKVSRAWSHSRKETAVGDHWAAWLSRELLGKVADHLTTRRLLIMADGALESLPFAALPDPRTLPAKEGAGISGIDPLVKNHEIVYLPSASVLATLRRETETRRPAFFQMAVIANPVFGIDDPRLQGHAATPAPKSESEEPSPLARASRDVGIARLEPLPFSAQEASAIADLVPPQQRFVATGFDASLDAILNGNLSQYQILHFATHGILNSKNPALSGLVLSQFDEKGTARNGFLMAHEISNLDLPAELAVLSACETGLGEEVRGEGIIGLTRSFMYAGVPRVIVSLWSVNDQGTAELMRRFYRCYLRNGYPAAAALRCAQLSMMKEPRWSSPYYWAPFVLHGEWRRRGSSRSKDDGISQQVAGTGTGAPPVTDYPPPILGGPMGCPEDLGKND
jgi:CHAT domain-containing protein